MKTIIAFMLSWLAFSATAEIITYQNVQVDMDKDYDKLRVQAQVRDDKIGVVKAKLYRATQHNIKQAQERNQTLKSPRPGYTQMNNDDVDKLTEIAINHKMKLLSLTMAEWDKSKLPEKKRKADDLMLIYLRIAKSLEKDFTKKNAAIYAKYRKNPQELRQIQEDEMAKRKNPEPPPAIIEARKRYEESLRIAAVKDQSTSSTDSVVAEKK